jgi:hypothetical protein
MRKCLPICTGTLMQTATTTAMIVQTTVTEAMILVWKQEGKYMM